MAYGDYQHWNETPYDVRSFEFGDLSLNVEPNERVGAPLPNPFKAGLRRLFVATLLVGGYWAAVANVGINGLVTAGKPAYEAAVSYAQDIVSRAQQRGSTGTGHPDPNSGNSQFAQSGVSAVPELVPAPVETPAAEPASTESMGEAYAEKAEPAIAEHDDTPKRKSAIAAGLSPDLPNVLLTRLSKEDLENAAYAIKTALAKTPDDGTFAWPVKPSRQQALFEVRFVQGAAHGCRRYIVAVTKDRWSSTSAAIEKCGLVSASVR